MRLLETVLPELALRKRLWADGPLMLWVRADGRKELVAITDGYRESMDSGLFCCATANAVAGRVAVAYISCWVSSSSPSSASDFSSMMRTGIGLSSV